MTKYKCERIEVFRIDLLIIQIYFVLLQKIIINSIKTNTP